MLELSLQYTYGVRRLPYVRVQRTCPITEYEARLSRRMMAKDGALCCAGWTESTNQMCLVLKNMAELPNEQTGAAMRRYSWHVSTFKLTLFCVSKA